MTRAKRVLVRAAAVLSAVCLFCPAVISASAAGSQADVSKMVSDAIRLLRDNKNSEAAAELAQAIKLNPNSAEAHHNYGLAMAKLGDMPSAIAELKKAIAINDDLQASWLTLGGLEQSAGMVTEAIATYKTFLQKFSKRADAETITKVTTLVASLQDESNSDQEYRGQTTKLQENRHPLLQPPASLAGNEDYLEETNKGRIITWASSKLPIRVFIHNADSVPGYKPQYKDILIRSFTDWATASKGRVSFKFVDSPDSSACDLECYFQGYPSKQQGAKEDAEAGEAKMYLNPTGGGFSQGVLKIFTTSMSQVLPVTDNRVRLACLHEIGHALGITGHTTDPADIMFYSTSFSDQWRNLSGRDARTIQRLYASK